MPPRPSSSTCTDTLFPYSTLFRAPSLIVEVQRMKLKARLSALALIISSTSGCGWVWGAEGYFRDRGSDYLEAQQTAPMQLPPDVNVAKRLDPLLPIPRNVADDSVKGEYIVPRPQPLTAQIGRAHV